ncbi:MAG: Arc family DNA-binding protein [Polaromonas sp.]
MSNLSIKDVPEAWAESLRQRAARNHRSLQGELMAIIEQAVTAEPDAEVYKSDSSNLDRFRLNTQQDRRQGRIVGYDRMGNPIINQGWKTIEQVCAEIDAQPKEMRPVYPPGIALSVDIIRAERDAR